jgi:hypothetical protein
VPSIHSVIGSGRRLLARHLTRLSDTLDTFGTRLREAVSSAIGETVSAIVRETVRAVLAEHPTARTSRERFVPSARHERPLWSKPDEPDEGPWYDDPYDDPAEEDHDDAPTAPRADATPAPSRLPRAIAVGFHTTLCWLRRSAGRFPVLTAVAVGVLTGFATYAGGPLAAAVVGLVGSAFSLLSLAEAVHTGADALAAFGSP